ncbi:MAG: CPBP family intramembrane metalloprotease [Bacteroidia bacterium]|nr:CPBP family intramembrane metalloprotease [Bacteroidia bacterium]
MRELLRTAALLVLLGVTLVVGGVVVGGMGLTATEIQDAETATKAAGGNALLLVIGFAGAALLYFALLGRGEGSRLLRGAGGGAATYGWIALLMMGLFPLLPWLGWDAESFRLPASLKSWEQLLELQEARVEAIMRSVIQHGSLPLLILFMAVAPGICEELFFRGALQTQLRRFLHPHVAIWLTALLFSLIHFQVYGLIPRALLGAIMGYLTWWTGKLWPAIWAHFLNNAYATVVAYVGLHVFHHPEWIDSTYRPPLWLALAGAVIAGAAGYQLYRRLHRA